MQIEFDSTGVEGGQTGTVGEDLIMVDDMDAFMGIGKPCWNLPGSYNVYVTNPGGERCHRTKRISKLAVVPETEGTSDFGKFLRAHVGCETSLESRVGAIHPEVNCVDPLFL